MKQSILRVEHLSKSYGKRMVIKDISMEARQGESVGLLGPNGAGKTTAFYCITGQLSATGGQIFLNSQDITHLPFYQRARLHIGYLPQENSVFHGLTVEQNIMAILEVVEPDKAKRKRKLDSLLEEFSIASLRRSPAKLRAHWQTTRNLYCWTNRLLELTQLPSMKSVHWYHS